MATKKTPAKHAARHHAKPLPMEPLPAKLHRPRQPAPPLPDDNTAVRFDGDENHESLTPATPPSVPTTGKARSGVVPVRSRAQMRQASGVGNRLKPAPVSLGRQVSMTQAGEGVHDPNWPRAKYRKAPISDRHPHGWEVTRVYNEEEEAALGPKWVDSPDDV